MPEMPAFLADVLEPRFARPAVVTDVCELGLRLRRVRFEGEALRGVAFRPGQEVELRVSPRAFRHYTPVAFDGRAGTLDVVFHLHGNGPGSAWAAALAPGSRANLLGPGGGFGLRPADTHVLLGDETTLGLFACLAAAASGRVLGAVEVDTAEERSLPAAVGLRLPAVVRREPRGDALLDWLTDARLPVSPTTCFYLAGHTASIARLRAALLRLGWRRGNIRTKPYWADGKRGL